VGFVMHIVGAGCEATREMLDMGTRAFDVVSGSELLLGEVPALIGCATSMNPSPHSIPSAVIRNVLE